jgi:hypothetical protein
MNAKGMFLIGTGLITVVVSALVVYYLRQMGTEMESSRRELTVENDCAEQVTKGIRLVVHPEHEGQNLQHVTESKSHYNNMLKTCFVEVSSYDAESVLYMKTLVNPQENNAILWTVSKRSDGAERKCFGPDSQFLECAIADQRWETYMTK